MKDFRERSFILGIAGGTGSGKSWLAQRLADILGGRAAVIQTDWYYRDRSKVRGKAKLRLNFDHPRAIDVRRLVSDLRRLKTGKRVHVPQYDYVNHRRLKRAVVLDPRPVLIVEGLFVLHEVSLRKLVDYGIFLDVPADKRLILRIRRDQAARKISVEETLRLYENYAGPMHEKFVQPSRRWADEVWTERPSEARMRKLVKYLGVRSELI